jgi:hypothetical protein
MWTNLNEVRLKNAGSMMANLTRVNLRDAKLWAESFIGAASQGEPHARGAGM